MLRALSLRRAAPLPARLSPRIASWFSTVQALPPGITELLEHYTAIPLERTRNFAIVAHVDHGKSISVPNTPLLIVLYSRACVV